MGFVGFVGKTVYYIMAVNNIVTVYINFTPFVQVGLCRKSVSHGRYDARDSLFQILQHRMISYDP